MRPNIAFDIDGVVANFSDAFVPYAEKRYGIKFIKGPKFHWDVEPDLTPFLFEKLIAWFIRDHSDKIREMPPGAELVNYVWNKTRKPITFITARHEMTCSATHHWIKSHFPRMDFVVITVNGHSDKIRYLDGIACFAEDRRRTAIELAEAGKVVFLPMRHYNWPMPDDISDYAKVGIIPLSSLSTVTGGSFDHLIFKQ
jgi:uncharacterized HAD superfamily protein